MQAAGTIVNVKGFSAGQVSFPHRRIREAGRGAAFATGVEGRVEIESEWSARKLLTQAKGRLEWATLGDGDDVARL